ncbi:TPA: helix-turn-helix transcriptional regulator [Streptococcus agalactiae]
MKPFGESMNKSQRLNDIINFLRGRNTFNIKDIMDRYSISKSTVLRDLQDIQTLGISFYSETGRNGKYHIVDHKVISPILFSKEELYSLFFSMRILKSFSSSPFSLEYEKLEKKFKMSLPGSIVSYIDKLQKIVDFSNYDFMVDSPNLNEILNYALLERKCTIKYRSKSEETDYEVQFIKIFTKNNQWYTRAYDWKSNYIKIFRCDKILSIKVTDNNAGEKLYFLLEKLNKQNNFQRKNQFKIAINSKAVDIYYKEHYPNMILKKADESTYSISGYFDEDEMDFLSSYVIGFGKYIQEVEPKMLKLKVIEKLQEITTVLTNIE